MDEELTEFNLIARLLQKAHQVAPRTTTDAERFNALRYFAEDIRSWVDSLPPQDRDSILQLIQQYLKTGTAPDITPPKDPQESKCFDQLLALIYEPPPLL
jgi:hypothetical protein